MENQDKVTNFEEEFIVAYGVLALRSIQASGNKDTKIEDLKRKDFAQEIRTQCRVFAKTSAIERSTNLLKNDNEENTYKSRDTEENKNTNGTNNTNDSKSTNENKNSNE